MVLAADPAPAGSPWWLVLALAVISALSVVLAAVVPKAIEHRRKPEPPKPAPAPAPDPPARADSALEIVQDAMDDLQRRLDQRDEELARLHQDLAEAHRRNAELLQQLRGRNA